jgi:hypothetical protein
MDYRLLARHGRKIGPSGHGQEYRLKTAGALIYHGHKRLVRNDLPGPSRSPSPGASQR